MRVLSSRLFDGNLLKYRGPDAAKFGSFFVLAIVGRKTTWCWLGVISGSRNFFLN